MLSHNLRVLGLALLQLFTVYTHRARAEPPKSTTTVVVATTTTTVVQYWPSPSPNIVNVCTTTHTDWIDWRAAPTPGVDFKNTCEDGPWSQGHELAYIPESALGNQELQVVHYQYSYNKGMFATLYWCCETCLGSENCAMYRFTSKDGGVCTHYIVKKGSGSKSLGYCSAGIFEIEDGPPQPHRPRNETGIDGENLYAGGFLPGPCYSAGRLTSWECSDGAWGGGGQDFVIDP